MSPEEKGAVMSKKNWSNILGVSARILMAFLFVFGQTAWAGQVQDSTDKSSSNGASKVKQAPVNPAMAAGAKAQSAEEETATEENSSKQEKSHRGGQHEGIRIHGHWTIEVRNLHGSVTRHVKFENSLDPGATFPGQPVLTIPGGAAFLSAILSGQWASPGQ